MQKYSLQFVGVLTILILPGYPRNGVLKMVIEITSPEFGNGIVLFTSMTSKSLAVVDIRPANPHTQAEITSMIACTNGIVDCYNLNGWTQTIRALRDFGFTMTLNGKPYPPSR